ncbi:hypothetical protein [Janthinobacterium sp. NKUCC06_STL]|uniref:hypothetical protein n=1 Tax=Janthinobacterium sp. NKUCC06_STL TaxID=2842127 RepID=UPI001C5ADC06|nr:hypothetical protein [Janthinobacterium sp. NKUCC06_STL]MBW3508794.1 hypothetical protein [Janthinobacterium sp. NKUCC06_STL]
MTFLKIGKARRICLAATLNMSLCLTYHNAFGMSRMAYAEVLLKNGTPCFTISQKEEARNGLPRISAIVLTDVSVKPAVEVWSFLLPGAATIPVYAKSCLPYGVAPATAEVKPPKAPPLKTGRMYDVFLNGGPADPSDPTRGYVGKFCLISGISGERKILRIDSDSQAWIDEICPVQK